ncbi:MAG: histidine ammonia-lyase [Thermoplasmata archaeon]|nr:histidine ammonia-lyase [Thermoplasmata archaeon]
MVKIDGKNLTIDDVVNVARYNEKVEASEEQMKKVYENRKKLEDLLNSGNIIYGVNTGFGDLLNVKINKNEVAELQRNLIRSHSSGTGDPFPDEVVRAAMLIRANALINGYSGVRPIVIEYLINMLNKNIVPVVPSRGSVGASGDLAPLAHMVLAMMGEGEINIDGKIYNAREALKRSGLDPLELVEKEGVALINGTSFMAGIASLNVHDSINLLRNAVVSFSLSLEALNGTDDAYRKEILELRPQNGQILMGQEIMKMIEGSEIIEKARKTKVQDAYSLRCTPQVLGPAYDTIEFVKNIVEKEINSVTDNPIVIDRSYSGGNFHGEYLAFAMDFLSIAISEIANISERRIARLVDSKLSGLPPFLSKNPGLNSGMMIPQYTAASLVSENKVLAHPASVDSIPTSANQEDHVSMGMAASIKASQIIHNVKSVIAIEYLVASQALEFRKYKMGKGTEIAYRKIREYVTPLENDRPFYRDINSIKKLMEKNEIIVSLEKNGIRILY